MVDLAGVLCRPCSPSEAQDLAEIAEIVVARFGAAPCAVVAAARRDGADFRFGVGAAGRLWPAADAPPARPDTPFDLASLTKPVTALALARLERARAISRSEPLADVLPALLGTASARTSIDLLSAHRGGLDGHRPLYAPLLEGRAVDATAALREAAEARRDDARGPAPKEGFPPVYSDLGYLLVGAAIAARGGDDVDRVMHREVVGPLGLAVGSARALRARDPRFDDRVAPTEVVPWRGGTLRGAVHDENAFAIASDAAAGHAGLFGDALSVAALGATILRALAGETPGWLEPDDLAPLVRDRPGGSLLAGFDRRSGDSPSSGSRFGPRTFGHLGFTGTSVWMDPDAGLVGVLLTNRVHPTRAADAIRRARPAAYDAIAERMR